MQNWVEEARLIWDWPAAKTVTSGPRKTVSDMSKRFGEEYLRGISSLAPHSPSFYPIGFDPYMVILNSEVGGKVSCLSLGSAR